MKIKHISDLPSKLPPDTPFEKLRGGGRPYRCAKWKNDRQGVFCMYYKFSLYEKKIPLSEIQAAASHFYKENIFDRGAFKSLCPISHGSGTCGFAVIGRILEKFFGAEYVENNGFVLMQNAR